MKDGMSDGTSAGCRALMEVSDPLLYSVCSEDIIKPQTRN